MTQRKEWGTSLVIVMVMALALVAVALLAPGVSWAGDHEASGQAVFMAQKCNTCHSVEKVGIEAKVKSEKMKGPDLTLVAADRDAEWFNQYLKKEADIDGKKHMKEFAGSDEELQQLIEWLQELAAE